MFSRKLLTDDRSQCDDDSLDNDNGGCGQHVVRNEDFEDFHREYHRYSEAMGSRSGVVDGGVYGHVEQDRNREVQPPNADIGAVLATMNSVLQQNAALLQHLNRGNSMQTLNYHIMPDLSKGIGTFNGEDLSVSKNWLETLISTASLHSWPDEFKLETAKTHLTGAAKYWFESRRKDICRWTDFEAAFRKTFVQEPSLTQLWAKMTARIQKNKENIHLYFHEKIKLCKQLKLKFAEIKEQVLIGLLSRELAAMIMAKSHEDEDTLYKDIVQCERMINERRDRHSITNKISSKVTKADGEVPMKMEKDEKEKNRLPARDSQGKPLCFICKSYGHVAKYCKQVESKPKKINAEPATTTTKVKESLLISANTSSDGNLKYFKEAKINGHIVRAYIDQGSKCVTLKQSEADRLNMHYQPLEENIVITGYGEGKVLPLGKFKAEVEVDIARASVDILIVPDSIQRIPLLIGQPFTEQPHITLLRRRNELIIFEEPVETTTEMFQLQIPACSERKICLWAKEEIAIPANHVGYISLYTDIKEDFQGVDLMIEPHVKTGTVFPRCVGRVDENNEMIMPVTNLTEDDVIVKKDSRVAKAKICVEAEEREAANEKSDREQGENRVEEILKRTNIEPTLTESEKKEVTTLIEENQDCFALSTKEIGCCEEATMNIDLINEEPITYRPYRLSLIERQRVSDQIEELKAAGIVEDSVSEFASPILIVRKRNGEERICIDYRKVNKNTKKDKYPLPLIDSQLDRLGGMKYYTSLDLKAGYYQIPITETSKHKTAFVTPDGHYQFARMPFGLVNGPAVFQRMINRILGPLRYTVAMAYMDDILVPSRTVEEGLERVSQVLRVLKQANLTLNPDKCFFFLKQIEYLGYEISEEGIRPSTRKIDCVMNYPRPQNVHQIRQFLGLTSYFRRFIKDYGQIAKPLTELLRKEAEWRWTNREEAAFTSLRKILIEKPVLSLYRPSAETEVHTDACKDGLGGILLQKSEDGKMHPVMYASRQTTKEESRYPSTELETLAIAWCVERWHIYLKGIHFKILTDCNAVRSTFSKKDINPRIARWWLKLSEYDLEVEHRAGDRMQHSDALSRNPFELPEQTDYVTGIDVMLVNVAQEDWVAVAQLQDPKIQRIVNILKQARAENKEEEQIKQQYELNEGRLFRIYDDKLLWVVPKNMRWRITRSAHDENAHLAVDKTVSKILNTYWFPRLRRYVKGYIGACSECLYHKKPGGKRPGQLHCIDKIGIPYHTIHLDHLGPFVKSSRGNSYLIVAIDGFTKHVLLKAVKTTKSGPAKKFLEDICHIYGAPTMVITDRGTAFTGTPFESFCRKKKIIHVKNATATPRANGQCERVNRVITPALASLSQDPEGRDWDFHVPKLQWAINTTKHTTTKKTPFSLLFNYEPRSINGDPLADELKRIVHEPGDIHEKREEALENVLQDQERQALRYNKRRCQVKPFHEGDLVMARREAAATGASRKLLPVYQGPYQIATVLPNDRYRLKDVPGFQLSQKPYEGVLTADSLKPWAGGYDGESPTSSAEDDDEDVEAETPNCGKSAGKTGSEYKAEQPPLNKCSAGTESVTNSKHSLDNASKRKRQPPRKLKDYELN